MLCIATLHHLASEERRVAALALLLRALAPGGRALVYVWALEQSLGGAPSPYIKPTVSASNSTHTHPEAVCDETSSVPLPDDSCSHSGKHCDSAESGGGDGDGSARGSAAAAAIAQLPLPVHVPRTPFRAQDLLVPWQLQTQYHSNTKRSALVAGKDGRPDRTHAEPAVSVDNAQSTNSSSAMSAASQAAASEVGTRLRFYHVFRAGELERLYERALLALRPAIGAEFRLVESYYDAGNWALHVERSHSPPAASSY